MNRRNFIKKTLIAGTAPLAKGNAASFLADIAVGVAGTVPAVTAAPVFSPRQLEIMRYGLEDIIRADNAIRNFSKNLDFRGSHYFIQQLLEHGAKPSPYPDAEFYALRYLDVAGDRAYLEKKLSEIKYKTEKLLPHQPMLKQWLEEGRLMYNVAYEGTQFSDWLAEGKIVLNSGFTDGGKHFDPPPLEVMENQSHGYYVQQGQAFLKQVQAMVEDAKKLGWDIEAPDWREWFEKEIWPELQHQREVYKQDYGYGDELLAVSEKPFEDRPQRFVSHVERAEGALVELKSERAI